MNQRGFAVQAVLLIVVVALIAVGAAVYFSQEDRPGTESDVSVVEEASRDEAADEAETGTMNGTITDLLRSGENLACTFSQDNEGAAISGMVYVAGQGDQIRGDFTIDQPEAADMNAHVISDGTVHYFWSDELVQGTTFSSPIDEDKAGGADEQSGNQQPDVLGETFDYSCEPWIVDTSKFDLPSDKEFVDLTSQVEQLNEAAGQAPNVQCATCEQLQSPAKEQCLQALGC